MGSRIPVTKQETWPFPEARAQPSQPGTGGALQQVWGAPGEPCSRGAGRIAPGCKAEGRLQPGRLFLGSHGAETSIALWLGVCVLTRAPCASRGANSPSYPSFLSPFISQILFFQQCFWFFRKHSLTTTYFRDSYATDNVPAALRSPSLPAMAGWHAACISQHPESFKVSPEE